ASLLRVEVGRARGVWSLSVGVIGVIGRASAARFPIMCFDQLAADVDPYQCAIRSDLDLHAHIPTRRHRIQGAIDSNMPVGMNLAVGPVRRVKAPALERNQNRLLFGLEDLDRYSTCRSMNAAPGRIPTPDESAALNVAEIDERFTLEEALPHKTNGVFHDGLIFRVPRSCRVGQKATVVGVLEKGPIETWCARIRLVHTCFHSVNHHAPWASAKELECLFKAVDDGDQVLEEDRYDAAQSAVTHHHHEAVNDTSTATTQCLFDRPLLSRGTRPTQTLTYTLKLPFVGPGVAGLQTNLLTQTDQPSDSVPIQTCRPCDGSDPFPGQPSPDHLIDIHHSYLPVCHPCPPSARLGMVIGQPGGG